MLGTKVTRPSGNHSVGYGVVFWKHGPFEHGIPCSSPLSIQGCPYRILLDEALPTSPTHEAFHVPWVWDGRGDISSLGANVPHKPHPFPTNRQQWLLKCSGWQRFVEWPLFSYSIKAQAAVLDDIHDQATDFDPYWIRYQTALLNFYDFRLPATKLNIHWPALHWEKGNCSPLIAAWVPAQ